MRGLCFGNKHLNKRHNFPRYAVKRRQMPSKASQCLQLLLLGLSQRCPLGLPQQGPSVLAPALARNMQQVLWYLQGWLQNPVCLPPWPLSKLISQRF